MSLQEYHHDDVDEHQLLIQSNELLPDSESHIRNLREDLQDGTVLLAILNHANIQEANTFNKPKDGHAGKEALSEAERMHNCSKLCEILNKHGIGYGLRPEFSPDDVLTTRLIDAICLVFRIVRENGQRPRSITAIKAPNVQSQSDPPPITVQVRCTILNVMEINCAEQYFKADVVLAFTFEHEELASLSIEELEKNKYARLNDIFEPFYSNAVEKEDFERWTRKDEDKKPENSETPQTPHRIRIMHRFKGKFLERMELRNFPFDGQELTIRITSRQIEKKVKFEDNKKMPSIAIKDNENHVPAEWSLVPGILTEMDSSDFTSSATGEIYSVVHITTYAIRNSMHFIYNYFIVLFLLTTLSGAAYAIPVDDPADRISVQVTLLLAVVAFKYVISQNIPRIPYNTILDLYILSCFFFLSIVTTEVAIAGTTSFRDDDLQFALVLGCVWFALNIVFMVMARCAVLIRDEVGMKFAEALKKARKMIKPSNTVNEIADLSLYERKKQHRRIQTEDPFPSKLSRFFSMRDRCAEIVDEPINKKTQ